MKSLSQILYYLPHVYFSFPDSLRTGRSGDRIPVGTRSSAAVQNGPGVHPNHLCKGYWFSYPGVKRPRLGVDQPLSTSTEVKEIVQLYLYFSSGPSRPPVGWNFQLSIWVLISGSKLWFFSFSLSFKSISVHATPFLFPSAGFPIHIWSYMQMYLHFSILWPCYL